MSNYRTNYYPNRTLCDVLEEMRNAVKTMNFSYLPGLIEEAQSLGNRMEAALGDARDIATMSKQRSELRAEIKGLVEQVKSLQPEKAQEVEDGQYG